jgi:hypothetical protein
VTLTFSDVVTAPPPAAWALTDRATGRDVSHLLAAVAFDPDASAARVTFVPDLPDGDYRLTLAAGAVRDPSGNASVDPMSFDFFHLAGDVTRDRAVNFDDLVIIAQNYNGTGKTWATGDLTGDGVTDFADLAVLAQRYNSVLPPPAPPPAPASRQPIESASALGDAVRWGGDQALFHAGPPIARRPAFTPPKPAARR